MTFMPRMTAETRAIRTMRPLSWRRWPGVIADVWHVQGQQGGGGFYRSPDPRLVVFLDDGAGDLQLRTAEATPWRRGVGAFYIPPAMPLWSELARPGRFAHLDLHLDAGPLAQRLRQAVPGATTDRPRFVGEDPRITMLARLIAAEVETPTRPDMASDGLVSALLAEVFDLGPAPASGTERGGLSPHMVQRLQDHARASLHRRIPVAELAGIAGLSESWLTRAFRQSLGTTPQRWLTALRIEAARDLMADPAMPLAEVAAAAGFADQAHLTRAFRSHEGQTPGAWRRHRFEQDSSNDTGLVQAPSGNPI